MGERRRKPFASEAIEVETTVVSWSSHWDGYVGGATTFTLNAYNSNPIYNNSNTVTPVSLTILHILKY